MRKLTTGTQTKIIIAIVGGCAASFTRGFLCVHYWNNCCTFHIRYIHRVPSCKSALVTAGSITTATAKTVDFAIGKWDQRKANTKYVNEFLGHYKTASYISTR